MKNKPVAADITAVCKDSMVEVVEMLRDVRMACILVLEWTLLSAVSDGGTSTRRSLRLMLMCGQSKIISEEVVAVEDGERRVEEMEGASEKLECSFRRLIQTRVSLLNILTSN
ncbi:unnamed protein product [Rhodiola kirilowii]